MLNKLQNEWRSPIIFILVILMMLALFISRSALSISTMLFVAVSFLHRNPRKQLSVFLATPLLWGMSLLFLVPILSLLWSANADWQNIIIIKLPLLALPLAFAGAFTFSKRQWSLLAHIFVFILVAATLWTLSHYIQDRDAVDATYLQARTMITPLGNDHVRFSWLISVAVLVAGTIAWQQRNVRRAGFWTMIVVATWLIIFLHVLAARTGLLSLYFMVGVVALYFILRRRRTWVAMAMLIALIVLPMLAYQFLPSFQNRVRYMRYDLSSTANGEYIAGSNDGMRMISWRAGIAIIREHPLKGVGFGDIATESREWYGIHYPQMKPADQILPSAEWLMYGAGAGLPGMVIFIVVIAIPFFMKTRHRQLWILLNSITALGFLFDIALETQFGVFIYAFFIPCCWKWLSDDPDNTISRQKMPNAT